MFLSYRAQPICISCRNQLLSLFLRSFAGPIRADQSLRRCRPDPKFSAGYRNRSLHASARLSTQQPLMIEGALEREDEKIKREMADLELTVREARQEFGDRLPVDYLSSEEYTVYERLYGPPLEMLEEDDVNLLESAEQELASTADKLFKENADGEMEEVHFEQGTREPSGESSGESSREEAEGGKEMRGNSQTAGFPNAATQTLLNDIEMAENDVSDIDHTSSAPEDQLSDPFANPMDSSSESARAHPLTIAGRFATSPSTIELPRESFISPIERFLANHPNKHLVEAAEAAFGGPGLPNSTATPLSKRHLQQAPVALEAGQQKMTEMEANLFLAAVMPGTYAAVSSSLLEVRRRLGSTWLQDLLCRPGGPRILDAGGGGTGVLAWRDILKVEWENMQPEPSDQQNPVQGRQADTPRNEFRVPLNGIITETLPNQPKKPLEDLDVETSANKPTPFGRATVLTGSAALRQRVSQLLDNTTFLPRLPDFHAHSDLPVERAAHLPARKQYDIVIAPHTLWTIREDYMRKTQIQNLWSLLNPHGGVLIIMEKGVPRGFELVAGARELLLTNHMASSGFSTEEKGQGNRPGSHQVEKEDGMIIAPCTNHTKCPMFAAPGQATSRKDFCHFVQRYTRPPFLQQLIGAKDRNHEDLRYSYIAVRRGRDARKIQAFEQGDAATEAAFAGHEEDADADDRSPDQALQPNMLTLPRIILQPLKRTGHSTLDLCTPSGKLERWTIPKSFGRQAYRDARKARWGDLWALGAKTRVVREARIGRRKSNTKRVVNIQAGETADETRPTEYFYKNGRRFEKRTKGGRVQRKPRKIED